MVLAKTTVTIPCIDISKTWKYALLGGLLALPFTAFEAWQSPENVTLEMAGRKRTCGLSRQAPRREQYRHRSPSRARRWFAVTLGAGRTAPDDPNYSTVVQYRQYRRNTNRPFIIVAGSIEGPCRWQFIDAVLKTEQVLHTSVGGT